MSRTVYHSAVCMASRQANAIMCVLVPGLQYMRARATCKQVNACNKRMHTTRNNHHTIGCTYIQISDINAIEIDALC